MSRPFGWSYPPGAANDPNAPWNQVTQPCDICLGDPEADTDKGGCVCPECAYCGTNGDPHCYKESGNRNGHDMEMTAEQIAQRVRIRKSLEEADQQRIDSILDDREV